MISRDAGTGSVPRRLTMSLNEQIDEYLLDADRIEAAHDPILYEVLKKKLGCTPLPRPEVRWVIRIAELVENDQTLRTRAEKEARRRAMSSVRPARTAASGHRCQQIL